VRKTKRLSTILSISIISLTAIHGNTMNAGGGFGSEIYCSMRSGGNPHEESWRAAYEYIKRQKGGLFKTSPSQAAGQIVETVVRERERFEYCLPFLSDLYPERATNKKPSDKNKLSSPESSGIDSERNFERYSY
tara:strand:- start:1683 stop:2084 length:402 start_codon:yes stop_codon:yes gene_type:complete